MVQDTDTTPTYISLQRSGELQERANQAVASLHSCTVCPNSCEVDRTIENAPVCNTGRHARVVSYFPHGGEEECLRGTHGSGTIFFGGCNMACVFCQTHDISQGDKGLDTPPHRLAEIMIELQTLGCHNINWVTPSHVVPQLLEATCLAVEEGLTLPIVYNSAGYDSIEMLKLLDGVVDIYMPDIKLWNQSTCENLMHTDDYFLHAQASVKEMYRQVGDLEFDSTGLARRGLLIRHLVMPNSLKETHNILKFIAEAISPETYINLMDQYQPNPLVLAQKNSTINRCTSADEIFEAYRMAVEAGLYRFSKSWLGK